MKVNLTTTLSTRPERVWEEVQTSRLLEYVAAPSVKLRAMNPPGLPEIWADGTYEVKMLVLGWLPAGRHIIRISRSKDGGAYLIRDNGGGQLAKVWDHTIRIRSGRDGATEYTDTVEVQAGLLTPFVRVFAQVYYRHRQRRWRALVE